MPNFIANRVQQVGTANTTVSFTLSSTPTGFNSFNSAFGLGVTCFYAATDGTNWESGKGSLSSATVLTRGQIFSSSLGYTNLPATFSGAVTVFCTLPAEAIIYTQGTVQQNGVAYGGINGSIETIVSTNGTNAATTSFAILTTNASGTPVWTDTIDGGTY
jgi:hypothetical protein